MATSLRSFKSVGTRVPGGVRFQWIPDPIVFAEALDDVASALHDRSWPLAFASQTLRGDVRERFTTETDPTGKPWQEWAGKGDELDSSIGYAHIAENYPNVGILRRDEILFDSATAEGRFQVTNDSVFYDSSDLPSYGAAHDRGLPKRRSKSGSPNPLPKRQFIGLSAPANRAIRQGFAMWFDSAISFYVTRTGRIGRRHSLRSLISGRFVRL